MPTIGELVVELDARTAKLETALGTADRKVKGFSRESEFGFRKIENAVTALGIESIGLSGKLGKLAEGALLFGAGGAATLALTAGFALVSAVMENSGNGAEEYQKQLDAISAKYDAIAKSAEGAARSTILFDQANKQEQLNEIQRQIADPERTLNKQGFWKSLKLAISGSGASLGERLSSGLQPQRAAILEDLAKIDAALADFDRKERERESRGPKITTVAEMAADSTERALQSLYRNEKELDRLLGDRMDKFINAHNKGRKVDPGVVSLDQQIEQNAAAAAAGTAKQVEAIVGKQVKLAAFMEETWKSAAQNIQSALGDTFDNLFKGQIKSLGDFAKGVVDIITRALAEIAAARTVSGLAPFVNDLLGGALGATGAIVAAPALPAGAAPPAMLQASGPTEVHLHVHAIDTQSAMSFIKANSPAIGREVLDLVRQNSTYADALRGR